MKKSILLGAAALAAIALAAPQSADAGEVKIGGYYQFRMVSTDNTPGDVAYDENAQFWAQRLQLNVDMKASEKSHAHMVTRVLDNNTVSGADYTLPVGTTSTAANWQVRQLWLETEAWGVGVKLGSMPIAMNDGMLFDHDVTSYGTILLAKNFGGVTVVGADVKVAEGSGQSVSTTAGAAIANTGTANHSDADFYVLSALGKYNAVDYQLTAAYLNAQTRVAGFTALGVANATDPFGGANGLGAKTNVNQGNHDLWLAATLGGQIEGIDLTGTLIYEAGMSNVTQDSQLENSGFMAGLRAKGKTGFGGWNGYAFYGSKDFTAATPRGNETHWSSTWDSGGPGAQDLMARALSFSGSNSGTATANNVTVNGGGNATSTSQSNLWGIGAGLTVNAGAWTIKPSLDYAHVVEDNITTGVAGTSTYNSALGGTLGFSTKIQENTTLDLSGTWVDPNARVSGTSESLMHYLQASVKMDF
ncbi:MAG: hypothetical protein HQL95_13420 [Magnetococcales bacterium]|nr:hypothetical protein [Magnetococcales bacterium]